MKIIKFLILFCLIINAKCYSQRHHGKDEKNGRHHRNNIIIKKSRYRPNKIFVYHPNWYPKKSFNRRWVYFTKHNLYWDNWRNNYVFWNGQIWISQTNVPNIILNINLQNEKSIELKKDDDEDDDIYLNNQQHQTENPTK